MLLALFDGAIERLEMAAASLHRGDRMTALRLLSRAQIIVCELAAGVDLHYAHAREFLHLYGVVATGIAAATNKDTEGCLRVLRTMRASFSSLRDEAIRLEREGILPPATGTLLAQTTA
jgi:flagellin-specific chaperone FliS